MTGRGEPVKLARLMRHFVDRLLEASAKKSAPVCVGIDPVLGKLPASLREANHRPVEAMETFCATVLEAVEPHAPCVKFQSACFERYFEEGLAALRRLMRRARDLGLQVILDAKRGDIGTSAAHYAAGCLADSDDGPGPDALTVNGYFGSDGLDPFLAVCRDYCSSLARHGFRRICFVPTHGGNFGPLQEGME